MPGTYMTEKTFEHSLKALEDIVDKMEHDELPLDKALAEFEKGVKLTKDCQKMLDAAEQKVNIITKHLDTKSNTEHDA